MGSKSKSFLTSLSPNKKICLDILIFLALGAVGVWDVTLIIDDYINSNILTVVKLVKINQTYPFLKDQIMTVEVNYFGINLFYEVTNQTYKELMSIWWNFNCAPAYEDLLKKGYNFSQLSSSEKLCAAQLLEYIYTNDQAKFQDAFFQQTIDSDRDDFMENMKYLPQLQAAIWEGVAENIMEVYFSSPENDRYDHYPVRSESVNVVSNGRAKIDLNLYDYVFHGGKNRFRIADFGGFMDQLDAYAEVNLSVTRQISIAGPGFQIDPIYLKKEQVEITLDINSNGIYDQTATTKCNPDPTTFFEADLHSPDNIYSYEYRCKKNHFLKSVVEKCKCIPFTYRRQFMKLNKTNTLDDHVPFCSYKMYTSEECNNDTILHKGEEDESTCLTSCIKIKNLYSFKIVNQGDYGNGGAIDMYVKYRDEFYTIYEERNQFSPQQLLSQVGGDLGLYTGISIWSVWQLAVLLYNYYQRGKWSRNQRQVSILATPEEKNPKAVWMSSSNQDFGLNDNNNIITQQQKCQDLQLQDLTARFDRLEADTCCIISSNKKFEDIMQQQLQNLERFDRLEADTNKKFEDIMQQLQHLGRLVTFKPKNKH